MIMIFRECEEQNIIERGVALLNGDTIDVAHLPEDLKELSIRTFRKKEGKISSLEEQEEAYIKWVLKKLAAINPPRHRCWV
jgi:DNA-binding NtrC family response regulator